MRQKRSTEMPKHVKARAAQDMQEEGMVRKLAKSHHAPADWKFHAQMGLSSWAGKPPNEIATELGCHPQTVRIPLVRFKAGGAGFAGQATGIRAQAEGDGTGAQPHSRLGQTRAAWALGDASRWDHGGPRRGGLSPVDAQCAVPGSQRSWDPRLTQPDPAHLSAGIRALLSHHQLGRPF